LVEVVVLLVASVVVHVQVYSFLHAVKPKANKAATARRDDFFITNSVLIVFTY
jgi:hypothetical protein